MNILTVCSATSKFFIKTVQNCTILSVVMKRKGGESKERVFFWKRWNLLWKWLISRKHDTIGSKSSLLNVEFAVKCSEGQRKYLKTRPGSPVDRKPSTAEAPPIGKINPFSKMAVNFQTLMQFWCPSGFRNFLITMT